MAKKKYKCAHCGETSVLKENDVRICLSCGFQSMPGYIEGSPYMEAMMKTAPMIVKELKFHDKEIDRYWIPSILDVPQKGMVFPDGTLNDWVWAFASYEVIPLFERVNYKVPNTDDEYYEYRLGLDKVEHFKQDDFLGALKKLGVDEEELM